MKIALLTVFDENYREIADRTLPTMRRYADTFGLEFLSMTPEQDRPPSWGKITRIREVLQSGFDYCLFVDADATFVRFDEDIRDHITAAKDLYLCWRGPRTSESYNVSPTLLNAGVMVWRNCAWSIDFLNEIWRQTDFIHHVWWEQAAILNLLGYRSALGQEKDDPDQDRMAHVQGLSTNWNVVVGHTIGPDPIITHFAGRSKALRLVGLDRENAFQPIREMLPLNERHLLSRQLNLMSYQLQQAEDQAKNAERRAEQAEDQAKTLQTQVEHALARRNTLLRSRSRLAIAWWRTVRWKLGIRRAPY